MASHWKVYCADVILLYSIHVHSNIAAYLLYSWSFGIVVWEIFTFGKFDNDVQ